MGRYVFPLIVVLLAVAHNIWPTHFDLVTLGLCLLATAPFLRGFLESIEIAGLGKFTFREGKQIANDFLSSTTIEEAERPLVQPSKGEVDLTHVTKEMIDDAGREFAASRTTELSLIGLVTHIEIRLREIAGALGDSRFDPGMPINPILDELVRRGYIDEPFARGIRKLWLVRSGIFHGRTVVPGSLDQVFAVGPTILKSLEVIEASLKTHAP